jgi:glutamate 5-kinase
VSQLVHKQEIVGNVRRVVIKVGSAVLSDDVGLRSSVMEQLVAQVASVNAGGREAVLVTSGAIAAGRAKMGGMKLSTIPARQAAAAAGQLELMGRYGEMFARHGLTVAQILLTNQDLAERRRRNNARRTIETLLSCGIIPIVNENDTVAVDEIRFGDNDNLSALVANLVAAQLLIILTDVPGVLTGDPRRRRDARLVPFIADAEAEMKGLVAESAGPLGTGGMASKLKAARQAARAGIPVVITSGLEPGTITSALDPERENGTLRLAHSARLRSRKHWIAFALRPMGALCLDRGAADALRQKGRSLLPSGIREVRGEFSGGDCVSLLDQDETEFGRGLVNYPAADVQKVKGKRSSEIAPTLGYKVADEIIHRDNLVLL